MKWQNQWDIILLLQSLLQFPQNIYGSPIKTMAVPRYTVPVGHNPLGTRMAPERYQAVYDLCTLVMMITVGCWSWNPLANSPPFAEDVASSMFVVNQLGVSENRLNP